MALMGPEESEGSGVQRVLQGFSKSQPVEDK